MDSLRQARSLPSHKLILCAHEAATECSFSGRTFHPVVVRELEQWKNSNPFRWQQITGRVLALEDRLRRKLATPPPDFWPPHLPLADKRIVTKVIVAVSRLVRTATATNDDNATE